MRRSSSGFSFRSRKQNHVENKSTRSESPSILTSSSSSARLSFQSSEQRISISSSSHQNPKLQKQSSVKEHSSLEKQSSVKKEEQRQRQRRGGASIMIGSVLILMSLGLTILWGRMWAITFNSMWLACIPQKLDLRLAEGESESDDEVERVVEESLKEARRRVIMEGLLDRRHHHHHQNLQQQQQKL